MTNRRRVGSSLVEMLVVLALLGVLSWSAWGLVDDAGRAVAWAGKTAQSGLAEPALALVRKDAERARPADAASGDWTSTPLELRLASGETVRWALEKQRLVRRATTATGESRSRVVAAPVLSFRWKSPQAGLRVVELSTEAPPRGWFRSRFARGGAAAKRPERRVDVAWVAAREGATEGSW